MTLLTKFLVGGLTASTLGGILFASYKLGAFRKTESELIKNYQTDEVVVWEYFLRGNRNADICGRKYSSSETIERNCDFPWSTRVKEQKEKIGLWIYGNKNAVNELLKKNTVESQSLITEDVSKKWNIEGEVDLIKNSGEHKCKVIDKPNERVLIVCK